MGKIKFLDYFNDFRKCNRGNQYKNRRENVVTQERNDTNISGKNKLENFNKDTGNMH